MIEGNIFHKEISPDNFIQYNNKDMVAYGKDWFEIIHDIDSVAIILVSQLTMPDDLNVQYIEDNGLNAFILSSCEWNEDVFIHSDEKLITNKNSVSIFIYIETVKSQEVAIANSMFNLKNVITREMKSIANDFFDAENYAEKSYRNAFLSLLTTHEISHVDGLLNKEGFSPAFSECVAKCTRSTAHA